MIGFTIAAVLSSPIVFLAIGFLGVSKQRAEEGRAHITTPSLAISKHPVARHSMSKPSSNVSHPAAQLN